jgi:hypothetical protein
MSVAGTRRVGVRRLHPKAAPLGAHGAFAHHAIAGKFDTAQPRTLTGIVTRVDWRDPHVHVFINVTGARDQVVNWAIELEAPVLLQRSGFGPETVQPGDAVTVSGGVARDGTRQVWGESVMLDATGRKVLFATLEAPTRPKQARLAPRWPDGTPRLGSPDANAGYWAYPSATALVEKGVNVAMDADGILVDAADAARVAPLQPWALGVYTHRQRRQLRDDPLFVNCKPPGGVRHMQSPLGVQLVEDRAGKRIFVLMGSGNHNYRIIHLDDREQTGQVRGDDDNPLYYGRSVGRWEDDVLIVDTVGFNEDFWIANGGLPHTSSLRFTERFSRPDFDTLRYEVTIDDPGAYTRPWSSAWELSWVGGDELPAYFCQDNRP